MNYQYPIREDWSTAEMINVIAFFEVIEKAYEESVTSAEVIAVYKVFKEIVPAMAEEKRLFKEFELASSYNSYKVVQQAKKGTPLINM